MLRSVASSKQPARGVGKPGILCKQPPLRGLVLGAAAGFALLLTGCGGDEVTTYEVPREAPADPAPPAMASHDHDHDHDHSHEPPAAAQPPMAGAGMMTPLPGMSEQAALFPTPEWEAPAGWEPQPLGSMRKGSWLVQRGGMTADMSVLAFPGDVGGELANMNRWRQQIGLPPVNATELARVLGSVRIDGLPGKTILIVGTAPVPGTTQPQATWGAFVEQGGGTWFFKLTGDRTLVEEEAEAFMSFLETIRFQQP